MIVPPFQNQVAKDTTVSSFVTLFLTCITAWRKPDAMSWETLGRGSLGKELAPLANTHLGGRFSYPNKSSDDCSLCQQLECNFMTNPEPQSLS